MTTDEELDARFGAADRAARLSAHEPTLVNLFAVSEAESLGRRRRRAIARAGIAGALVIGLGVGAPTAAAAIRDYLSQTGRYCSGTECGAGVNPEEAEWIDSSKSDFGVYVDSLFPTDLPLADGSSRAQVVGQLVSNIESANAADGSGGEWTALGLSSSLENIIYCGWVNQWLAADAAGDAGSAQRSAEVMRDAAEWPATVKTDGGGVADAIRWYADAANRGDAATVLGGAKAFACVDSERP